METYTFWQIKTGFSSYHSKNGDWRFKSEKEAIEEAKQFKANPNNGNNSMTEENKAYHSKQSYQVQKVTETIEDVITI